MATLGNQILSAILAFKDLSGKLQGPEFSKPGNPQGGSWDWCLVKRLADAMVATIEDEKRPMLREGQMTTTLRGLYDLYRGRVAKFVDAAETGSELRSAIQVSNVRLHNLATTKQKPMSDQEIDDAEQKARELAQAKAVSEFFSTVAVR
jgi:hypothetical protein